MILRRAISLAICFVMMAAGLWLMTPVFTSSPRFGVFVMMGVGLVATAAAWTWTEFIERSDD